VTIHHSDPFATPEGYRSPIRRLRARLPAPVTLWTAAGPAGLTVSSTLIADGEPGRVYGLVDEESDLWAALHTGGAFAVIALGPDDRRLADRFAGLMPAPGGQFRDGAWRETGYGPVPEEPHAWAGCRLVDSRPAGWGLLVEAVVEHVEIVDLPPLVHHRGRYLTLD
jgi:3-hydroxy-9,10-secoandrosta-1,3,5(10)-triene-9,17-dione monooxygenase reductase component